MGGRALTFRLAGINNQNFILRDEETGSWWQQVSGEAFLGPLAGARLEAVAWEEVTFAVWKAEHPDTLVLLPDPDLEERYAPADWEERIAKRPTVTPEDPNDPLKPRDLVVGIRRGPAARAYPWAALVAESPLHDSIADTPIAIVIHSDGRSVRAFDRRVDGRTLTFRRRDSNGVLLLTDDETASEWNFAGVATAGPLAGRRLERIPFLKDFWFDWKLYNPDTSVHSAGASPATGFLDLFHERYSVPIARLEACGIGAERHMEPADPAARATWLDELRGAIRESGAPIVELCVRAIVEGSPRERERAQLLLAQVEALEYAQLDALRRGSVSSWAYATLRERVESEKRSLGRRTPAHFDRERTRRAVAAVGDELARGLAYSPARLANLDPEFVADYRRELVPRLEAIGAQVEGHEGLWQDLDGDGGEELALAVQDLWDSRWHHDLRFVAIIEDAAQTRPRLASFFRLLESEQIVERLPGDFDGDGSTEVAVRSVIHGNAMGGACFLRMIACRHDDGARDAAGSGMECRGGEPPTVASGWGGFDVLVLERGPVAPAIFVARDFYPEFADGASTVLSGALAVRARLYVWERGRFAAVDVLHLPVRL